MERALCGQVFKTNMKKAGGEAHSGEDEPMGLAAVELTGGGDDDTPPRGHPKAKSRPKNKEPPPGTGTHPIQSKKLSWKEALKALKKAPLTHREKGDCVGTSHVTEGATSTHRLASTVTSQSLALAILTGQRRPNCCGGVASARRNGSQRRISTHALINYGSRRRQTFSAKRVKMDRLKVTQALVNRKTMVHSQDTTTANLSLTLNP